MPTTDAYFSVDIEADGPIPGPYSMLSFGIVYAGSFDGSRFQRPADFETGFYAELRPIAEGFDPAALKVSGLDRARLAQEGRDPAEATASASAWIDGVAAGRTAVLVAYPLSYDWMWLYWYFMRFCPAGSPFRHSRAFDIKTALAVKGGLPIARTNKSRLPAALRPGRRHTHHALDDAAEQAEIFANLFAWQGPSA